MTCLCSNGRDKCECPTCQQCGYALNSMACQAEHSEDLPESWFDALGKPVSGPRYKATLALLVAEGYDPAETAMVLDVVAREIRCDNPDRAMSYMTSHLGRRNMILVYRALATMAAPNDGDLVEDLQKLRSELS